MIDYCEWCGTKIPLNEYADGSFDQKLDRYIYLCETCHKKWCKEQYSLEDE